MTSTPAASQLVGQLLGGVEDFLAAARGHHVDVGRGDVARPDQALVVVVGLGQGGHRAGHADAVGAHGDDHELAVLVQHLQVQGLGVLAAQLEDVAHLDAAGGFQRAGSVRGRIACAHLDASMVPSQVKSRPATRPKTCLPASLAPVIQVVPLTTRGSTR